MKRTLLMIVSIVALAGAASAQNQWQKNHPRRAQVNHRVNNAAANGKITGRQAARDKREERAMARKDGGHITAADQAKLNERVNRQEAHDAGH